MALIECPECKKQVSDQAATCIHCGYPLKVAVVDVMSAHRPINVNMPPPLEIPEPAAVEDVSGPTVITVKTAKSRGVYIILGLLFGFLGFHNFYAGYYGRGLAQMLLVCILGWFVIGFVIVFPWVIVEMFTVKQDGSGTAFA